MGRPGSRSRAPMECDLFCVNNMPFFLFFSFPCGNRKIYIFLKPKNIPLLFLGPPLFSTVGRFPFFLRPPLLNVWRSMKRNLSITSWKEEPSNMGHKRWVRRRYWIFFFSWGCILYWYSNERRVVHRGLNSRESCVSEKLTRGGKEKRAG